MNKIKNRLSIVLLFISLCINAQNKKEIIHFESANPFSLSDIITDLESQEKQRVFGQLTIPVDSLNSDKKIPFNYRSCWEYGLEKTSLRLS